MPTFTGRVAQVHVSITNQINITIALRLVEWQTPQLTNKIIFRIVL